MPSTDREPDADRVLTYASGARRHDAPISKVAILSLITTFPMGPVALMLLAMALEENFPTLFGPGAPYGSWLWPAHRGGIIIFATLPIVALARIYLSHGRRRGAFLAVIALMLWIMIWTLTSLED